MEIPYETIMNIAGLFLSGSVGGFVAWKYQRRKMKAEAQTEEVNMAQAVQDTYQKMLKDKEEEVSDKNRIISELREDRDHFRQDRNELRERIDKTESLVRELQEQVIENRREIDLMRPFLCGVFGCKQRKPVEICDVQSVEKPKKQTKKKEQ